jgi:hypothetical protein
MSIGILQSFTIEWDLLYHIDKSRFKLKVTISDIRHRSSLDICAGWSRKVIDALGFILETDQ